MPNLETGTLLYVRSRLTQWGDFEANGLGVSGPKGTVGMLLVYDSLEKFMEEYPNEKPMLIRVGDAVPEPD